MSPYERSRWRFFGALALPLAVMLAAAPWLDRPSTSSPETPQLGTVPWLVFESAGAWEVRPLGIVAAIVLSLVSVALPAVLVFCMVKLAQLTRGRCQNCGYPMVVASARCPECGRPHPDPIIESTKTRLGPVHRPLIVFLTMVCIVPGAVVSFVLVNGLVFIASDGSRGVGNRILLHGLAFVVPLCILVGVISILRYLYSRRDGWRGLKPR